MIATLLIIPLAGLSYSQIQVTPEGMTYAILSGAVTSGIGYAMWYTALRGPTVTQAGVVQLLVPTLAALGGVFILGGIVTPRLVVSGVLIVVGVGWAMAAKRE